MTGLVPSVICQECFLSLTPRGGDRVKGQTAIFEEMIEDEEGLMDDRLPTTSRGLWAASETERTLKAILAFAKLKRLDPELVEEGNTFMELFENWKKEYKVSAEVHDLHDLHCH